MKKKLLALVCALALTVSLVGCVFSTPDTVGKIGDFEVTSGLYLLAQYDAYQQAAQLAGSEQDASKVKSFLKATITTDADTGETAVVSDYVAQKTLETLQTLAAVDARFTELGGELTEEQKSAADSYAQQLMDNYGDTYTANGIGLETLKLFQQLQYKHTLLLDLVYGKNGETPVEDGELTEHLDSTMYEIGFITVPLYNTSTFAFASDDQKAEMLSLAQKAADSYNASAPEDTSSQLTAFNSIASSALTDICAVLDAEVPSTSTRQRPSDRPAERKRPARRLSAGGCRRYPARPCLRAGSRHPVHRLRHDAGRPSGPAGRLHAGRSAQPDPERPEGRGAGRCPCRLRCPVGQHPEQLCHEQTARRQDRERHQRQ